MEYTEIEVSTNEACNSLRSNINASVKQEKVDKAETDVIYWIACIFKCSNQLKSRNKNKFDDNFFLL